MSLEYQSASEPLHRALTHDTAAPLEAWAQERRALTWLGPQSELQSSEALQGYLAHNKQRPPRTLQQEYA